MMVRVRAVPLGGWSRHAGPAAAAVSGLSSAFSVALVWTVEECTFCPESLPNITPNHKPRPLLPVNLGWRTYLS